METLSKSQTQSWLSWFFRGLLLLGFLILVARLVDLQVIRGDYFRTLAEGNRVRRVPIVAPRGEIRARGGEVLVGNKEVQKRVVFDTEEGYTKTLDIEGAPAEDLVTEYTRDYRIGYEFAHVSGYLGQVSEGEAGKVKAECLDKGPRPIDALTGRGGLEQSYECELAGINGEELVEVDSLGNRVRTLGSLDPIPGSDLLTTIDYDLQRHIAQILRGEKEFSRGDVPEGELKAAVVVTDTKGEILALYSSPSYNPNAFVHEGRQEEVEEILSDERLPLFNRAIGGAFHPGSVFKPVVAVAALEEGAIDEDYTYEDTGSIVLNTDYGTFSYSNWLLTMRGGTEGVIDLPRAIARSTDTFFYKIGELTGIDALAEWAEKFGFGLPTGIDIPGEISGLVPNPEWKRLAKAERWFLGNTYHFSIGQGDNAFTPLQVNTAIAAIASRGQLCKPHLAGESECIDLDIDDHTFDLVWEGMIGACDPGGTAFTFFEVNNPESSRYIGKPVACKTGTAETGKDTTHAWLTFFGPISKDDMKVPEIVVTVLVEEGGEGSNIAGPVARSIYDHWFGIEETEGVEVDSNSDELNEDTGAEDNTQEET